jgi:transcription elongation factor Elf1
MPQAVRMKRAHVAKHGRSIKSQEVFRCPHCQIRYAVTYIKTPIRDSGSAYCKNCRQRMSQWSAYKQPSYALLDQIGRIE